jgi:hypothetical protein
LALVASAVAARRLGSAAERGPYAAAIAGAGIGFGALMFAGTLCGDGHKLWPGLLGGLACAALASAAVRPLLARAAARLDAEAAGALWLFPEAAGLLLAGLSVAIPPISIAALLLLAWLAWRGRGRGETKYAGLRTLR